MKRFIPFLLLVGLVCIGCKKFDADEQAELDEAAITQYIAENGLSAISTGSGLHYVIDSLGTGLYPDLSSTVTVAYKGYLLDSTVFDESSSTGATFPLSSVITGWQEGIPKFKEGGYGMLLIPSALGYGNDEVGDIPKNSVLFFNVVLLDVQ